MTLYDSHAKGCLNDDLGEGEKAGQGSFRLTRTESALAHVLSGFLIDRRMWSSAEPFSVVQSIRTPDGQDASELRYAAAGTIWVRWTFQLACGRDQPPGGARGPQAPPTRPPPSACCAATGSPSPQWPGPSASPARPSGAPSRWSSGPGRRHVGIIAGAADPSLNVDSILSN